MKTRFSLLIVLLLILLTVMTGCQKTDKTVIRSVSDLHNGARAGLYGESCLVPYLSEYYPDLKQLYIATVDQMLLSLRQDKIDTFIMDLPTLLALCRDEPGIAVAEGSIMDSITAFLFSDTPEALQVRDEMNEFLDTLDTSGELSQIYDKWITSTDESARIVDYSEPEESRKVLNVAIGVDQFPYDYIKDNKVVGYEVDILYRFGRAYGYTFNVTQTNYGGMYAGIQSKMYVLGASNVLYDDERAAVAKFSRANLTSQFVCAILLPESAGTSNFIDYVVSGFRKTFIDENRWKDMLQGVLATLDITLLSLICGTLLGYFLYLSCRRGNRIMNALASVYVWLINGMPIVVLLLVLYYIVFSRANLNPQTVSIIAFTLVFGSGFYSQIKSAVDSLDPGQMKAALALGYPERKAFNRMIFPQAVHIFTPAYCGSVTTLVKSTAIVGYITVVDLTRSAEMIRARTFDAFFPLLSTAVIYFVLAAVLNAILHRIIGRIDRSGRTPEAIRNEVCGK